MQESGKLRIRLERSEIGGTRRQRSTLRGLGLRRIGDVRVLESDRSILGMIQKVRHLVSVEAADGGSS